MTQTVTEIRNRFHKKHPNYWSDWYEKNKETALAKRRLWAKENSEAVKKYQKKWRRKNRTKFLAMERTYKARYRTKPENAQKLYARNFLNRSILKGQIQRPERCESCLLVSKVEAHHKDYSKPLDILWLCVKCHRKIG